VNDLTHIDLFSGIGGFALAAQWTGFRTIAFCEIEPFCQEVLKARFGAVADTERSGQLREKKQKDDGANSQRRRGHDLADKDGNPLLIPDIRDFDGTRFRGATLLTGGVPCQPASVAGKRKGTADDRWLWPEAIRVLAEVKPTWAIFENPPGILSLEQGVVFEDLLSQMEGEGYEVRPIIIPACAVNAPHRRDRVWIVAHHEGRKNDGRNRGGLDKAEGRWLSSNAAIIIGDSTPQDPLGGRNGRRRDGDSPRLRRALQTPRSNSDAPNPQNERLQGRVDGGERVQEEACRLLPTGPNFHAPDAADQGLSESRLSRIWELQAEDGAGVYHRPQQQNWDIPWIEVATRLCRVDARVSNQVDRLKALGNSIVPQVAYEIIKEIAGIEGRKP